MTIAGSDDAEAITSAEGVEIARSVDHLDVGDFGGFVLQAIGLRGHTPGSIALLLRDGGETILFSGDSLFPGGPGKTWKPEDFTSLMDDLEERVFDQLPNETKVLPGHGDDTTLGAERPKLSRMARTRLVNSRGGKAADQLGRAAKPKPAQMTATTSAAMMPKFHVAGDRAFPARVRQFLIAELGIRSSTVSTAGFGLSISLRMPCSSFSIFLPLLAKGQDEKIFSWVRTPSPKWISNPSTRFQGMRTDFIGLISEISLCRKLDARKPVEGVDDRDDGDSGFPPRPCPEP